MKSFITVAIASLIAAAAIGTANTAEAKARWKIDNVQFMKDGMKGYAKNCLDNYCGNWNVKG